MHCVDGSACYLKILYITRQLCTIRGNCCQIVYICMSHIVIYIICVWHVCHIYHMCVTCMSYISYVCYMYVIYMSYACYMYVIYISYACYMYVIYIICVLHLCHIYHMYVRCIWYISYVCIIYDIYISSICELHVCHIYHIYVTCMSYISYACQAWSSVSVTWLSSIAVRGLEYMGNGSIRFVIMFETIFSQFSYHAPLFLCGLYLSSAKKKERRT